MKKKNWKRDYNFRLDGLQKPANLSELIETRELQAEDVRISDSGMPNLYLF